MDIQLNLPKAVLKQKADQIWDPLRRKFVKTTPEEWVRQQFIDFLISTKGFPSGRMVSEYKVSYNGMNKRCDIAVFDTNSQPQVIVECKAPQIKITEDTFYQIAKYAHVLQAPFLILTNGLEHYCALVDAKEGKLTYLETLPTYAELAGFIG